MIVSTPDNYIQPAIQHLGGKKHLYRLLDDYRFEWRDKDGYIYARTVYMMDYETDLASVPTKAQGLGFNDSGSSDGAAVLHDQGYRRLGVFKPGEFQVLNEANGEWLDALRPHTRKDADKLYKQMCILGGMSKWKARVEYWALRVGAIDKIFSGKRWRWYFS